MLDVPSELPRISGTTALLATVGDPVAHVQSPRLVNELLAVRARDAVLVPMHVARQDLGVALAGLRVVQNLRGAVITMPHKEAVLALLDDLTPEARLVGACNVIRREGDGRLVGAILDGEGCVAALLSAGRTVRGRRVLLVGAGGAAKAIAFALARHGARQLTICNRTPAKAETLARRVRSVYDACDCHAGDCRPDQYDIIVHATPLGMRQGDGLPIVVDGLQPGTLVVDIVLAPEPTPLLREAARRGCLVQSGRPMLEAQIALMVDFMLPGYGSEPTD
jgi:shikimate dehydrogenase